MKFWRLKDIQRAVGKLWILHHPDLMMQPELAWGSFSALFARANLAASPVPAELGALSLDHRSRDSPEACYPAILPAIENSSTAELCGDGRSCSFMIIVIIISRSIIN